jgi:LysM repeat protein
MGEGPALRRLIQRGAANNERVRVMSGYKSFIGDFKPLNAQRTRQTFHEICPPGHTPVSNSHGGFDFIPHRSQTRDAAPNAEHIDTQNILFRAAPSIAPNAPSTIGESYERTHTLQKILGMCDAIGQRIEALELRKAQQQQLVEQQQLALQPRPAQVQFEQPNHQPTQDRAAPCSCQHQNVLMPQPSHTHDGVNTMQRNAQLAPLRGVTFDPAPRSRQTTRDQNNFGETKQVSRFDSVESARLASYMPPGSARCPTAKELNDAYAAHWARDAGAAPLGAPGVNKRGAMVEAVSSDPSEAFLGPGGPFTQFRNDDVRPSPAALGELNRQFSKAKTQGQRDAITDAWKSYMSAPRDAASMSSQWKPRQPAISPQAPKHDDTHDAPWSNLYEQNKSTIGGDPNKIAPGMSLSMPGGGTHVVQSGETLSGIASTPAGTDLGQRSLSAERGGMESTPAPSGSYSSGGSLSSGEGAPAGAPGAHNAANVPTPPTKPSDLSESSSSSSSGETPTPPVKPASLGGTGESPSGTISPMASEGGGASSTGSEGTGLAKMVRGWVGDARPKGGKPRGRR